MSVATRTDDAPAASGPDPMRAADPDLMRAAVAAHLVPLDIRPGGARAGADRLVGGDLGAVRVAELTTSGPDTVERTPTLIRQEDHDLVKVDLLVTGRLVVEQGDRQARLDPGDLVLVDLSRPCRWVNSGGRMIAVSFPRSVLPLRRDATAGLTATRIPGGEGAGALLSSLVRQLPRHLDQPDVAGGARIGTAVVDLVTGALAARLDRPEAVPAESRRRAMLTRIVSFIERQLTDPDLAPDTIAAAHHISVRYLHRLMESQHLTVSGLLRARRLERCQKDLLDPALLERPVSAIAARWGLTNPTHFSRAFREVYGLPPAAYRRLHVGRRARTGS